MKSAAGWRGWLVLLALAGCAATPPDETPTPEQPTPRAAPRPPQHFTHEAVVAAHPLAAEAGAEMLRDGGSAVDAAIAAQLVLGLVEPQSSGLGGGAFLLHWDGVRVRAYDGRETAPASVDERLFLAPDGRALGFLDAAVGGRSVGVPGVLRMLELAHHEHGRLAWSRLFEPAIALATHGFSVGSRLHALLQDDPALRRDPWARALYYGADGQALPVGAPLRNPEYAALLREIAAQGTNAFYRGPFAAALVKAVAAHPTNPGGLAAQDLVRYRAREREPLCHGWRRWRVCGMPPPSSGALVLAQWLGLLDRATATSAGAAAGSDDAEILHAALEASRLAYADRERYVGDPDFVAPPAGDWTTLIAPDYLDRRARLIGPRAMDRAPPGLPPDAAPAPAALARSPELPATSQLSIVDHDGHAVAMTTSIEAQFGARVMVNRGVGLAGGFLLNNQLTDFSFVPRDAGGVASVNRVEGGKRPRSSMAPTLVFARDAAGGWQLQMVAGSPGGVPIPLYVGKALRAVLVDGLDAQAATALPNFVAIAGPAVLEAGGFPAATRRALQMRGQRLREASLTSGLALLVRETGGWQAGSDPRREGWAAGR